MGKRKYQTRDLKDILSRVNAGENVMYQLPTGGGKSIVASEFVHAKSNKQIVVIAHRRELILQMEQKLSSDKITPGVLVGDIQRELDSNILIGSIQTLSRTNRLNTILNKKVDIVIVDEAHHLRTPSYDKLLNHLKKINPNLLILGLSATPYRSDKKDFREYIDTLITSESVDSLIAQGYLSKFRTYVTNIGDIEAQVEKNESDYNIVSLSKYMRQDKYLQYLVDQYVAKGEGRQTLIFAVDRNHLQAIVDKFIENGFTSIKQIHAETKSKEREQSLQDYRDGKLQFIASIGTLTEGTDLPETGCLIIARPTESLVLFHQILGRGMRPKSDGSDLIILDCAGITLKHGSVNSPRVWSLDPDNDPKQKTKRCKIVGRRKDGSYSDDIDEIEAGDLEVIEMSPEEYFSHSANAIEEAQAHNEKIETEVEQLFTNMIDSLGKLINALALGFKAKRIEDDWQKERLKFTLPELGEDYRIEFKKVGEFLIPQAHTPYGNRQSAQSVLKINTAVGQLSSKMMSDNSHYEEYENMLTEVDSLRDKKIDVNAIKEKQKEFKRGQLEITLAKAINKYDGIVTLLPIENEPERKWKIRLNDFRDGWGYADTIGFCKKKLLKYNEVNFADGEHFKLGLGSLELDRILDLLEGKVIKI